MSGGERPPLPAERGPAWPLALGVFALALAVRALELWQLSGSPLLEFVIGDAVNYTAWGREIAAGDWLGDEVFYQAPLYPYFLGLVFALGGDEGTVRLLQCLLGSLSCAFLALAGRRLLSWKAGLAAGTGLALYAPVAFSELTLQKSVLDTFLLCAALWGIAGLRERPGLAGSTALGAGIGLLCLSRENALVFAGVLLPWIAVELPGPPRRRAGWAAGFALGLCLVLVPVALRNTWVGGSFALTSTHFGHNLYIGNNPAADGTYKPLRPGRGDPRIERQDAVEIAEAALGRELSLAEVSRFYTERALDWIVSEPGDWAALLGRKALLLLNAVELVDTEDLYSYAEESWLLGLTSRLFHFGLLAPLALLGACVTWPRRRALLPLYAMAAAYAATLLVFYVFGRYRLPLVPILLLFAGAGVVDLPDFLQRQGRARVAATAAAVLGLALLCRWPLVDESHMRSVTQFNLGNELVRAGRSDEGIERYREALRLRPDHALAAHNLGSVLAGRGELDEAKHWFERALQVKPERPRTWLYLGFARRDSGELEAAAASFEQVLRLDPGQAEARQALAGVREALTQRRGEARETAPATRDQKMKETSKP